MAEMSACLDTRHSLPTKYLANSFLTGAGDSGQAETAERHHDGGFIRVSQTIFSVFMVIESVLAFVLMR